MFSRLRRYEWQIESLCPPNSLGDSYCGDEHGRAPAAARGTNGVLFFNGTGASVAVVFRKAGTQYTLSLVARRTSDGAVAAARRGVPLVCKYVRREIRALTTDDRETFLDALEIAHRVPLDEGKATYVVATARAAVLVSWFGLSARGHCVTPSPLGRRWKNKNCALVRPPGTRASTPTRSGSRASTSRA